MSSDREQSAIDAIYEILDKIDTIDKRTQIMDDNIKLLSNKVSKLSKNAAVAAVSATAKAPQDVDATRPPQSVDRLVLGNIKTYGYIVNKAKMPISEVIVNVYDNKNKLVKNTKTNQDGYWEVRLPPEKYGVEYIHKKFKPINRVVTLENGTSSFEVR